jgi:hypothetical protein
MTDRTQDKPYPSRSKALFHFVYTVWTNASRKPEASRDMTTYMAGIGSYALPAPPRSVVGMSGCTSTSRLRGGLVCVNAYVRGPGGEQVLELAVPELIGDA